MIKSLFEMTEEQEAAASMVSDILAYVFIAVFIIMAVLFIIAAKQMVEDKKEYIKKLDEHDKSVILDYENLNRWLPRRKKKNNDK